MLRTAFLSMLLKMGYQGMIFVIILSFCATFSDIEASTNSINLTTVSSTSADFGFGTTESEENVQVPQGPPIDVDMQCVFKKLEEHPDMPQEEYLCICGDKNKYCNNDDITGEHLKETRQDLRKNDAGHVGVKGAMYIVIFLTGLFGNLLVIVTVSKYMGRMTVTNIYILNLAVADLLVILICVPTKVYENVYMIWDLGEIACKLALWLYFGSFMCSAFTLMSMALERYMVINHPMRSQMMSSVKRTLIVILFVWVAGILCSLPTFFLAEVVLHVSCAIAQPFEFDKKLGFYLYIFVVIFLIPSTLMAFAYIKTSVTLWKSIKKQQQMKSTTDGTKEKSSDTSGRVQEYRSMFSVPVIRVLIGVLVVFVVCWAPYLSVQVYLTRDHANKIAGRKSVMVVVSQWFNFLSLANSCLNPILYGVLSRQFRKGFLRCLTCNKKGKEVAKSYVTTTTSGGALTSRATGVTSTHQMKPIDIKSENEDKVENGQVISNGHVEENKTNQQAHKNDIAEDEVKANVTEKY